MRPTLVPAALASLLLLAFPLSVAAQRQTRMVLVTPTNASGAPVLDLTASEFEVREGDAKRTVTFAGLVDFPMRIMVLVDTSGEIDPYMQNLKTALPAFVDAIPDKHEIGVASLGRQFRVRLAPTTDHAKIKNAMSTVLGDGGGTVLLDGLRESESRFQKKDGVHWPVYVIITTDGPESSTNMQTQDFKNMQTDMIARGTTVHGVALQRMGPSLTTDIVLTLAKNFGGEFDALTSGSALTDKLKAIAARIVQDYDRMAKRYQVEFTSDAKYTGTVDVGVTRPGVKADITLRR